MSRRFKPLQDQTIVITGTSSGIGLTTARMAAKQGARLVLAARNEPAIHELANEIKAAGGDALAVPTDVGREEEINRLAQAAIDHYGGFDTWVNNAAVSIFGYTWDVTTEDMRRMFDIVFWHVVYGSRAAMQHFRGRSADTAGSIINIGSLFGDRTPPLQSTYASAKAAEHGFTDAMRAELEAEDAPVSVTLIHPGRIDTPFNEHARAYTKHEPSHRDMVYAPQPVAEAILYAATHDVRDLYVGSQAKAWAVANRIAPRLVDKVAARYLAYWGQVDPSRPAHPPEQSALYGPGRPALHERGSNRGFKRARSYYLKAEEHPVARDAALVGLVGAGTLLGARRFTRA